MKKFLSLCMAALLCLGLFGCAGSSIVKIGFVGSETAHAWSGRFKSYNGSETRQITADGSAMELRCALTAGEGWLGVSVETLDGRQLFSVNTQAGDFSDDSLRFDLLPGETKYLLRVTGEQAKNGSFNLDWSFE